MIRVTLVYGLLLAALTAILPLASPHTIVSIFLPQKKGKHIREIYEKTATLLAITAIRQLPILIKIAVRGLLRGYKDTKRPMIYGLAMNWLIGLPLILLSTLVFHWGVNGIFTAQAIAFSIYSLILIFRLNQCIQNKLPAHHELKARYKWYSLFNFRLTPKDTVNISSPRNIMF